MEKLDTSKSASGNERSDFVVICKRKSTGSNI